MGRTIAAALLVLLVIFRWLDPAPVETLRLKVFDLYLNLFPRSPTVQPVAVVDIDEETLAEIGQWPWPRTLVAELVERIQMAGAAVIGFDILFAEADRMSPHLYLGGLQDVPGEVQRFLESLPGNDQILARTLQHSRSVLGQSGYPRPVQERSTPPREIPTAIVGRDPRPFLIEFPGMVRNIEALEAAATGLGIFTLLPERDGVVRRVPAVMMFEDRLLPSLAIEMLRVATGSGPLLIRSDQAGVRAIGVGGVQIPTDRNGRIWVHYARHDPRLYISAGDVLNDALPPGTFAGKLVVVGTSATGLYDVKTTPLDAARPGAEIHAQLLETILARDHLVRPHYALGAELILTAVIGLVVIVLVPITGAWVTLLLGAAIGTILSAGSLYLFAYEGILLAVGYPLVASLLVYIVLVFHNYFHEEAERRYVRLAFSQYLSPALVEKLARDHGSLRLGGEAKQATILFCDMRGFTSVAELYRGDPQGLTSLMNRLLTPLTNAVVEHGGTIDKYIGDAIMAFWNAPLDDPDHSANACRGALAMLEALEQLNEQRMREAKAAGLAYLPLKAGIGINTGECVVGNLGSDLRFDYSILGDAVNIASRLEGQTKHYGVPILAGEATAQAVSDRFAMLEIDQIRVIGKQEPERIFVLLGDESTRASESFQLLRSGFGAALQSYRNGSWSAAREALESCYFSADALGISGLVRVFEARIEELANQDLSSEWDGIYSTEKK